MRRLRMISCSLSSFTRKVAFGGSSVTTPGNSRSSSLPFGCGSPNRRRKLAETAGWLNRGLDDCLPRAHRGTQRLPRGAREREPADPACASFVDARAHDKPLADFLDEQVAHGAVRIEPLLAISLSRSRIRRRPIF